jgi:chromosome condensin MukBEF ATPase and DNA-binding subunit MukB
MTIRAWLAARFARRGEPEEEPRLRERLLAAERERDRALEELAENRDALHERTERLYELQQHYSSEHFGFQESMRELKIERLRNAGTVASHEIALARARDLQHRIASLKERLRRYEAVENEHFDDAPIVETERHDA